MFTVQERSRKGKVVSTSEYETEQDAYNKTLGLVVAGAVRVLVKAEDAPAWRIRFVPFGLQFHPDYHSPLRDKISVEKALRAEAKAAHIAEKKAAALAAHPAGSALVTAETGWNED